MIIVWGLCSCAGPDPGPGDMEPAGTVIPEEILECRGDRDGTIAAAELPLLAGVTARQRVYGAVDISSAGSTGDQGLVWDMPEGGELIEVRTEPIDGMWFADQFPTADYAVAVDPAEPFEDQILGLYQVLDDRVLLLGTASRHSDRPAGGLVLPYDEPAEVLRFPVELGDRWEQVVTVSEGRVGGAAFSSEDTYRFSVNARGAIRTPDAVIRDALRLRIELTIRTPALDPVERLEYVWYRECVGEAARMTATEGETGPEITRAAQLRVVAF